MVMDPSQLEWLQKQAEISNSYNSDADEQAAEVIAGGVAIPKTGLSVNDEMMKLQNQEDFISRLFPLEIPGVAVIETVTSQTTSDEPMRYLVPLNNKRDKDGSGNSLYAMVDCPPYSESLVNQMKAHMKNGKLFTILITCRTNIHYNEAQAVYTTRKSDLLKWKKAFPDVRIVAYRLDTPRDCREMVSQQLDGYGPWALENGIFQETGRPLTVEEWDEETQKRVIDNGDVPPDDDVEDLDDLYSPQAIRNREENKDILAIYTPGHTYGSVTYIFPNSKLCCPGFTLPVEDTRSGENNYGAGRKLDFSGYLTTNMGDIDRQVESGRRLVMTYGDRFDVVCPARGPSVNLEAYGTEEKQRLLLDMISDFHELGRVYNSLGIIN
jgi:glyoxylase-like metal-dependent hydrolase (beta-lactamase superfamily II)